MKLWLVLGGGIIVVGGGSGVMVSGYCGSVLLSVDDFIVCVFVSFIFVWFH